MPGPRGIPMAEALQDDVGQAAEPISFSLSFCPDEATIELTLLRSSPTIELSAPEARMLATELDRWLRTIHTKEGDDGDR